MGLKVKSQRIFLLAVYFLIICLKVSSQVVPVGSGSYTTQLPPADAAGRNNKPAGTPRVSGLAASKAIPTNDWWTGLLSSNNANLYNYPLSMKAISTGLVVSYTFLGNGALDSRQPMGPEQPIIVGLTGLNVTYPTVSNHSDWLVQTAWNNGTQQLQATMGTGMPFVYFTKASNNEASITVNIGTVSIQNEMLLITNSLSGSNFAVYGPVGTIWTKTGNTYTSSLAGKNYFSAAMLPQGAAAQSTANLFKQYAYVFPMNSTASYNYNQETALVQTTFNLTTEVKEGLSTEALLGLLPHQWAHLSFNSPKPGTLSYQSARGALKMLAGNGFVVENKFNGVLPTLPNLAKYSSGFDPSALQSKIELFKNPALDTWTDSYNEGLAMNRLMQVARIAAQTGNFETKDKIVATVKARLEDWLKVENGENAFLFYYNVPWTTLIGFPAGYSADANINDHHFHYGNFILTAAAIEEFVPGWAASWGPMVTMMIRDAANWDRSDIMFPYLRNFSPYAGHSFASGLLNNEPHGNNQESSSEAMNFNAALIQWGQIIGNIAIRDLGIYLYTTEQTAIDEYYFNKSKRNFSSNYSQIMCSRVWNNGYDRGTFWTNDIAAMYGIELFPLTGSSLYLAHDTSYVRTLWNDMKLKTGVSTNTPNDNLWFEIYWSYLAMIDPETAIKLYNNYTNYKPKGGCSDAQTYHWLHTFNSIGYPDASVTANYPIAAVFNKKGVKTYVAKNYGSMPLVVNFSDGFTLTVLPGMLGTNREVTISARITALQKKLKAQESGYLNAAILKGAANKVEFYDGLTLLRTITKAPFQIITPSLNVGIHRFYVKAYADTGYSFSNVEEVIVGSQLPYLNKTVSIPTQSVEAGNYDYYEGGIGQGISYFDNSITNQVGNFRSPEYVDAGLFGSEGNTVEFIEKGEWLSYSVFIEKSGIYRLNFRYSSGLAVGGGPFSIAIDTINIVSNIRVNSTSNNWKVYATKQIDSIVLPAGNHILKLNFDEAGFNLGKLSFTLVSTTGNVELSAMPIVIFPNPATDKLTISTDRNELLSVKVYNLSGLEIMHQNIETGRRNELAIQELKTGLYLLAITREGGSVCYKRFLKN
jgi:endoglucanase Acf2